MAASDINIRIGAKLDGLQREIKKAQSQLTRFADFAENTGRDLSTRLSLPIIGVGVAAVSSFAKFERLELGLKALADEGENTGETMARLQKIALLPGIGLEQAINGANQLRTVGFEAAQAEEILKGLSKAVTISGAGPEQLQSVIRQFTQMSSKGRILQEDLSIILENVPSVGIAIQDAFGTQNIDKIKATGVSTQEFIGSIIKAIDANEKFQKAQGGVANELENFGLAVNFALAGLGRTIAESINLSGILQSLSGAIQGASDRFQALSPGVQKVIVIFAATVAAIGPLIFGFGAVIKIGLTFAATIRLIAGTLSTLFLNPVGLAVLAIGGLVAAFVTVYKSSETFRATIAGLIAVFKKFATDAIRFLKLPFDILSDILSLNFDSVADRFRTVFGKDSGTTAGQEFAAAYNASISSDLNAEKNFGKRGRLGGSVTRVADAPKPGSVSDVFANLPKSPTTTGSTAEIKPIRLTTDEYAKQARTLTEIIGTERELQFIRANGRPAGIIQATAAITSQTAAVQGLNGALSASITDVGAKFQALPTQVSFAQESLNQYGAALGEIDQRSLVFGASFDALGAKISATKAAIDTALGDGFTAASENVVALVTELSKLEVLDTLAGGIQSVGAAIGNVAAEGALSFQSFAKAAVSAIGDVIAALIQQGVAAAIANAFKNPVGVIPPLGAALAAGAGLAAAGLFKGLLKAIPGLADGGIIPPGFSGDKFPAFLNSGEAVIPLDRLFKELGGGAGGSGEFVVRGQDLVLVMDRANNSSRRVNGR
jgi:tape measure domain-containing protein